jgi:hypothetical protein
MLTINKNISLSNSNQKVVFEFNNLPTGDYQAILIMEERPKKKNNRLVINEFDSNINSSSTFSREDIYENEDR